MKVLGKHKNGSGGSWYIIQMIPCEVCDKQVPLDEYVAHAKACVKTVKRKRDDISSIDVEVRQLPHGAFYLKQVLDDALQRRIYEMICRDGLADPKRDPSIPYGEIWNSNKSDEDITPVQLLLFDIGQRVFELITEKTGLSPWRDDIHLDSCSATCYDDTLSPTLTMHIDWGGVGGWVVVLSLGVSAHFRYGHKLMSKAKRCIVKSGDAAVLKGSEIYHGIQDLEDDLPKYWTLENTRRIAIQMRDHRANVPGWEKKGRGVYRPSREEYKRGNPKVRDNKKRKTK